MKKTFFIFKKNSTRKTYWEGGHNHTGECDKKQGKAEAIETQDTGKNRYQNKTGNY